MTTGLVLVLAVLILGGAIATLGDRIGMKVGKARLSLFNLRPRQTATVVSVVTGSLISASTLGLLFAVNRQLRTGVFQLEQIETALTRAQQDLATATASRDQVKAELQAARQERIDAQERLRAVNESLRQALQQQQETVAALETIQGNLQATQGQLAASQGQLAQQRQQLQQSSRQLSQTRQRLAQVSQAAITLAEEIRRLQADRDSQIAQRDREIQARQARLGQLQAEQETLEAQVRQLERQFSGLFLGTVAISRNETLVAQLVRVPDRRAAEGVVAQLVAAANRRVLQEVAPGLGGDRPVIILPEAEITRLVNRLSDGQEYIVRILAGANYVIGEPCVVGGEEPCVQVFSDVLLNRLIYPPGERIAAISVNVPTLSDQALAEQLSLLVATLRFRTRQDGVIADTLFQVGDSQNAIWEFLGELRQVNQAVEIQAIAVAPIPTAGPILVDFIAVRDSRIVARTPSLLDAPPR